MMSQAVARSPFRRSFAGLVRNPQERWSESKSSAKAFGANKIDRAPEACLERCSGLHANLVDCFLEHLNRKTPAMFVAVFPRGPFFAVRPTADGFA